MKKGKIPLRKEIEISATGVVIGQETDFSNNIISVSVKISIPQTKKSIIIHNLPPEIVKLKKT